MANVKHVFSNGIADGTNNSIVRPSDWNSGHNQLWTLSGNTSLSSTASGTNIILGASGGYVSLIGSSDSIIISSPASTQVQIYSPPWNVSGRATNSSLGNGTLYFQPFDLDNSLSASRINFYASFSGSLSNGNSTGTCAAAMGYAIYTRDGNAGSQSLNLLTSYQLTVLSQSMTSNTAYNATHYFGLSNATSASTTSTGITNANASTYQATNVNGIRVIAFPVNLSMTPGRYWLGFSNCTTAGNAMTNNISIVQTSQGPSPQVNWLGFASAATNASVFQAAGNQGWGSYSATSAAWPATIAFTTDNIRAAAAAQTLIHFDIVGYSTSTNIA